MKVKSGYIQPEGRVVKKALKINEIEKIYNYSCDSFLSRDQTRDLWLFSYLMNGANMNDIVSIITEDMIEKQVRRSWDKLTKRTYPPEQKDRR